MDFLLKLSCIKGLGFVGGLEARGANNFRQGRKCLQYTEGWQQCRPPRPVWTTQEGSDLAPVESGRLRVKWRNQAGRTFKVAKKWLSQ